MAARRWVVEVLPFVPVTPSVRKPSAHGKAAATGRVSPPKLTPRTLPRVEARPREHALMEPLGARAADVPRILARRIRALHDLAQDVRPQGVVRDGAQELRAARERQRTVR